MSQESKTCNDNSAHERFADYFAICGLDELDGLERHTAADSQTNLLTPLQVSYKSSILWHFPENDASNIFEADAIKLLCMPRGVYFRKQAKSKNERFHSFLQTKEDGQKIYGFVLTFYEVVKDENILAAVETLFKMFNTDLLHSDETCANTKCSKSESNLLSKQQSWSYHSYCRNSDNLYVSKCICLITRKPFVTLAKQILEDILNVALNEDHFDLRLESYIYNALFEIPSPPFGRTMRYITLNRDPIVVQNPHLNELPYFDYSMKEVLMTLGFDNLVDLFTCMLLEHQILLLSSDLYKLMLIAESLTTLFFPLLWQHVYVPVLPPSLLHFLDAPVPFIMGLYYETEEEKDRYFDIPCEASLCLLDVDSNDLLFPKEIPELPGRDELIKELRNMANMYEIFPPEGSLRLRNDMSDEEENSSCSCECSSRFDSYDSYSKTYKSGKGTWPRKKLISPGLQRRVCTSPVVIRKKTSLPGPGSPINTRRKLVASNWAGETTPQIHRETDRSVKISLEKLKASNIAYPRLAKMISLAEKAGLNTSDVLQDNSNSLSNKNDLFVMSTRALTIQRKQQHENEFNIVVQEIFVNCFTQMLVDYEHFVILPQQTKLDWLHNREHMQNFDKASFLSDQSLANLAFMTLFVETQGFASLIDMKIMALWENCDPKLAYFDKRIDKLKVKLGIIRNPLYEKCTSINSSIETYVQRCCHIDHNATQPHHLKLAIKRDKSCGYFPLPEKAPLIESKKRRANKINWRKREKLQQQQEHNELNEALKMSNTEGQKMKEKLAERVKKYMQETKMITKDSSISGGSHKTLHAFGEKLLKECMIKTKRLVVLKLGQDAVELGHLGPNNIGIEENTLIASLCDLLERVWSHGVQLRQLEFGKESAKSKFVQRMRQSKSALWSHLLAFYHKETSRLAAVYGLSNTENITDDVQKLMIEKTPPQRKTSSVDILSGNITRMIKNMSPDIDGDSNVGETERNTEDQSATLLPNSPPFMSTEERKQTDLMDKMAFLDNLKNVLNMKEIKTDTGYARAWTRLALEKKVLAKDLRILLSQKKLLITRYKDYAFIRTDDEMEQFVYYLLSLNAVDFYCFTNGFSSTAIVYKIHIVTGKNITSSTTANCWINLTGSFGNTGTIFIPKGDDPFRFRHKNLGILNALQIGHDNSGISPSWFVEYVAVTNMVTGRFYRFQCGRWLAKSQDDGSTERLLIAEVMNKKRGGHRPTSTLCLGISDKPAESATPTTGRRMSSLFSKKVSFMDIQEKVADAVNNIVKFFYRNSEENMTLLLCGDGGFCQAMELVFQHGFKSNRLFGKKIFIWDFIEKVCDDLPNIKVRNEEFNKEAYNAAVKQINGACLSIGKDQKFQLLVLLGLREHFLQSWFKLLHISSVTANMYESCSFFRDGSLLNFLIDVMEALLHFDVVLDKSITRGI